MDDFGTGYSSLSYLQSFPFDKIKIDQSFISKLGSNPQSATIVRGVVGLARGLHMPVVAEGVETALQRDFLAQSPVTRFRDIWSAAASHRAICGHRRTRPGGAGEATQRRLITQPSFFRASAAPLPSAASLAAAMSRAHRRHAAIRRRDDAFPSARS